MQYREKSERLQKLNEDMFNEMQDYKMQLVGVQEIKKDRDDRIDRLRAELDALTRKYDILEREHTSMKVNYQHIQDEHATLKADYDNVSEKLHLSNKVRNEKEELLADKTKQMHLLNENYTEKEATVERLKREIEKMHKRLSEMEMQNDQLDIKKKSAEKQSEIQRKQLLEKISTLNEVISHEKDTREQWIQRYEKEQKNHMQTSNELLLLKGSL